MRCACNRIMVCVVTLLLCLWLFPAKHVCAESGMEGLTAAASDVAMPDGVDAVLEDMGISAEDPTSILTVSPSAWFSMLWASVREELAAPVVLLTALLTLILLSATLAGMNDTVASGGLRRLLDTLCVLISVGAVSTPICTCLTRTADALTEGGVFMGSFVPVFGGFLAAGGAIAAGTSYQVLVFFLTELMQQLNVHLLFPLLTSAAALGIADAVHPALHLGGLVTAIRKLVTWLLGFLMTAFAALLSVRSFVASAADGLGTKTVKLLTSSLIPVVGGAVSDAYGTVQGSIRLLQSGTGILGVLAIAWLTVPPLLSVLCYRAAFGAAGMVAELVGAEAMGRLCKGVESVLSAAFAMLVTYAMMLMFSTAIMLMLTGSTS